MERHRFDAEHGIVSQTVKLANADTSRRRRPLRCRDQLTCTWLLELPKKGKRTSKSARRLATAAGFVRAATGKFVARVAGCLESARMRSGQGPDPVRALRGVPASHIRAGPQERGEYRHKMGIEGCERLTQVGVLVWCARPVQQTFTA